MNTEDTEVIDISSDELTDFVQTVAEFAAQRHHSNVKMYGIMHGVMTSLESVYGFTRPSPIPECSEALQ